MIIENLFFVFIKGWVDIKVWKYENNSESGYFGVFLLVFYRFLLYS